MNRAWKVSCRVLLTVAAFFLGPSISFAAEKNDFQVDPANFAAPGARITKITPMPATSLTTLVRHRQPFEPNNHWRRRWLLLRRRAKVPRGIDPRQDTGQKGDPKQFGLYLQKDNPPDVKSTDNFAPAGARIIKIAPLPEAREM